MGDTGATVMQIQLALKDCGFSLNGTGYFGPSTDVAVEAFQKRAGLHVDGMVGPQTAKAIDAALGSNRDVIPPAVVKEIGRPLWLEAGIRLIGTKRVQGPGDNPVIIQWAQDLGGDIAKEYTHDSIPFCALFMNYILAKVGVKGTETLWALDFAGKWPSVRLSGPAVGAIAPMLRNGGGHVMCVVGKDQHGNIMGLGSNQSSTTSIVPFATSRLNQGFWWPSSVSAPLHTGISTLPTVKSDGQVSSNEA